MASRPACCARKPRGAFASGFPSVSEDEWLEVTRAGVKLAHSRGVTAVHDKDGWVGAPEIFQRLRERGGLTLRVWQSLPYKKLPELESLGIRSRFGDDFLRLGYLKVFMDGTLGSQTAWMLDGSGVRITSGEELAEIVRRAARAGWPVGVHAIGDRANREALDAFEATKDEWAPRGLRQRIEHAQCLAPEDLARFAELGVTCSVQFSHAPSDRDLAERFWPDRLEGAYAFRSLRAVRRGSRQRLGRADRGARSAGRDPGGGHSHDRRAARLAHGRGADGRGSAARDHGRPCLARGRRANARKARARAISPTWWFSRATRSSARRRSSRRSRSSPRWWAAAGCTTPRRGELMPASTARKGGGCSALDPAAYELGRPGHAARVYEILGRAVRPRAGDEGARDRPRHRAGDARACSSSARPRSSRSSRIRALAGVPRGLARRPGRGAGRPRSRTRSWERTTSTWPSPHRRSTGWTRRSGSRGSSRRSRAGGCGSHSGGRSSVSADKPDAFMRRDEPAAREPAAKPDARRRTGGPHTPSTRSARLRGARARRDSRTLSTRSIALVRTLGHTAASAPSTGASRRSHGSTTSAGREILDGVAGIAERDFGGRVERTLVTGLYTARKPA